MAVRTLLVILFLGCSALAERVTIADRNFVIPDGYELEVAAGPPLTKRPIVADFDEQGRLYVAESSGSNEDVETQLASKPHSILRLEDTDGDGKFDKRTIFADRMMFPEGAMWLDGSLYVAAPPSIWKLTDSDGDGVAEQREEWFQGQTLTGCANDLHGPYRGPDGWIYWCKGAFAEQTYPRPGRNPLVTRAAHVFRRRPTGGPIEAVMTGGMDNPVELVFTPGGERIFSTTFLQHPAGGRRDGLIHAIYGGVYGKRHGVLDGHPRTGALMPVLTHLGAAAPSGLARLQSSSLGFKNQLLTACFNLHSVTRHELVPQGATFATRDAELVVCDDLDFHPTDVLEDADGSVLIIDTGGWYKLCCPTSQLHKPDILGAIYRLRRKNVPPVYDPRGLQIAWKSMAPTELCKLLADERPWVSQRAGRKLSDLGTPSIDALADTVQNCENIEARVQAVWSLCRIDAPAARAAVRIALHDSNQIVRQAAGHAVSIWRDRVAIPDLIELLNAGAPANQRVAAEALGRMESQDVTQALLSAVIEAPDRVAEHSLLYALIESNAPALLHAALESRHVGVRRAALIALEETGNLIEPQLREVLASDEPELEELAMSIAAQHANWGDSVAALLRKKLAGASSAADLQRVAGHVAKLADSPPIRALIIELLQSRETPPAVQVALLRQMRNSSFHSEPWNKVLVRLLSSTDAEVVSAAVQFLTPRTEAQKRNAPLTQQLKRVARSESMTLETRLAALQDFQKLDAELFDLAIAGIGSDRPPSVRGLATTALSESELTGNQLEALIKALPTVSPLELSRLLNAFEQQTDKNIGKQLFDSLSKSSAAPSLPPDRIARLAVQFGDEVVQSAQPLLESVDIDPVEQIAQIEHLLQTLPTGDVRRGQRIFHNEKTACFACHAVGYRGGSVGPDLTRIGRVRSRRDLLEAVLYPNASFVRSYEPVTVIVADGRALSGAIRDQTDEHLVLQLSATEQKSIPTADIEEILPGKVSVMPAGLDKQLSTQQLADLLSYLESRR